MNSIERAWRDILFDIYKNGHIHQKDDAEIFTQDFEQNRVCIEILEGVLE